MIDSIIDWTPIDRDSGLLIATTLPGRGEDFARSPEQAWAWLRAHGDGSAGAPTWVHLDLTRDRARGWIRRGAGLDEAVAEALLTEETRPRFEPHESGILVIFRGVNMNPGAEPDDLIALRMWVDPDRVITLRAHRFSTITQLHERARQGRGPATPGAFLATVARELSDHLGPVVEDLDRMLGEVEEHLLEAAAASEDATQRQTLADVRRQAITYRRYMVPQRDAMMGLALLESPVLDKRARAALRLAGDQVARVVEDLEELRDRAAVTSDELRARRELRMSRTMYLLAIVTAVAMPLTLLSGLLGMNVGGIPGARTPWGFAGVCAAIAMIAGVEVWVLRRLRWL